MIIESGNALPLGTRKPTQHKFYIRRRQQRNLLPASVAAAKILKASDGRRELPAKDSRILESCAQLFRSSRFPSRDSARLTKREYRRAAARHLKVNILRIRAGFVGLPGTIFSLFTTLRAAAPRWQAWM